MPETRKDDDRGLLEAGVAAAGMCLFALFIHKGLPFVLLSACGLAATAGAVVCSLKKAPSPAATLGLSRLTGRVAGFAIVGCALGVALGLAYRLRYGLGLLLGSLRAYPKNQILR